MIQEDSGKIVEDKKKATNDKDNKLEETKANKNDDNPCGRGVIETLSLSEVGNGYNTGEPKGGK